MCIFLKQWVLTTHCFSQVTARVKSSSASAAECGGPRPSVPPHFYFLYELLSSLPSPGSGDDWGGGPQRPEGSHKDNMAMSLGNNIAKESSKGGDESVVFSRQQDYLLYNCCITVLCVDQCDMAPISAHPYLSLILINRLDFGSKKKWLASQDLHAH